MTRADCYKKLDEIALETAEPDWDCYGAVALTPEVFTRAKKLLELLPEDMPLLDIGPTCQGDINFEWYFSDKSHDSFGFLVTPDGDPHRLPTAFLFGRLSGHCVLEVKEWTPPCAKQS